MRKIIENIFNTVSKYLREIYGRTKKIRKIFYLV